jgi:FkbM family methyltransferase
LRRDLQRLVAHERAELRRYRHLSTRRHSRAVRGWPMRLRSPDRKSAKGVVRSVVRRFGFDVVRYPTRRPRVSSASVLRAVAPTAGLLRRPLVVVDAGARWGVAHAWSAFDPGHVEVIGFEPDDAECRRLKLLYRGRSNVRFVPLALGSERGSRQLYVTADPAAASLYQPDEETIRRRPELRSATVTGTVEISLVTLDEWTREAGIPAVDAIKLDVQGAELDVLRGAARTLETVRALELEVEFNEIYHGQPLFADIDRFVRASGFVLWRLGGLAHYGFADEPSDADVEEFQFFDSRPVEVRAQGGQLFWGHAYYVRRELATGASAADWGEHVRDGCVAAALGFPDLARQALRHALKQSPEGAATAIRRALVT